jgi:DNA-binding transcriptional LysR family regulator
MTLQQLHYIIEISETGSMNKAAEQLYIAQPSLTSAVKELEKEIGIQIFNRSGRGVTLTADGVEFLTYARQVYQQYETLQERYSGGAKKKFSVSAQHYSFAVQAFVETVQKFDSCSYEFAMRETTTFNVISDVSSMRSEIGILYLSDFNAALISKILRSSNLEFHKLIECDAYVYIWKGHPLEKNKTICFDELAQYPCLSFEQGGNGSMYFAEEILTNFPYPRTIKATDRATMLNLMIGLNGYTLCSGIICEELNGSDYVAVPYEPDETHPGEKMIIGYITKKKMLLSSVGQLYIDELKKHLGV